LPEQYPEKKVQLLLSMLSKTDVVLVDNPLLKRLNINGLLILSYKLSQQKASHGRQAYTFTAVSEKTLEVLQSEEREKETQLQKVLSEINDWVSTSELVTTKL